MSSNLGRVVSFVLFSGDFFLLVPHATKKRLMVAIWIVLLEIKYSSFFSFNGGGGELVLLIQVIPTLIKST